MIEEPKYKILFLPTLARSIAYYRIENYMRAMQKCEESMIALYRQGDEWSWELNLHNSEIFHELDNLASNADIIISQAIHTQEGIAYMYALKERYGVPIYGEFDDDPYSISAKHPYFDKLGSGSKAQLWTDDFIKFADGLFVSTDYLGKILPNDNTIVVPNAVNFDIWDNLKESHTKSNKIRIGWVGGGNHSEDLELIYKPINKILDNYPNVQFVIAVGNEIPEELKRREVIKFDLRHWKSIETYPQFVHDLNLDIAIAPLRDRAHNRAKSNLKWLEFSALKLPLVASPVEPYNKTNAFLAKGEDQWYNKLVELIENQQLRTTSGEHAYNVVKRDFNVETVSSNYLNRIKRIIDLHRVKEDKKCSIEH